MEKITVMRMTWKAKAKGERSLHYKGGVFKVDESLKNLESDMIKMIGNGLVAKHFDDHKQVEVKRYYFEDAFVLDGKTYLESEWVRA